MTNTRTSRVDAIAAQCRSCIHDPLSAGTWREQIAACPSANCPLFPVRPVPRNCLRAGEIDPTAIAALRKRLDDADRRARR